MKCPECKEEITYVRVFSQCMQLADLEGSKLTNYSSVEEVLDTESVECPECFEDITASVIQ